MKYTAGKLTDNKPNIYTVYQTYIFINILVLASLPKFQYRLGSTLHNYSVCLSWENKGVDYVEVMWHDPDTVIAGWPPGSDEKMSLLTKKRRLKRNRKYLVTVMHPFPMAALLEDRNKTKSISFDIS